MTLPTPLDRCSKIFMLHMNFKSRAKEHGDWPDYPVYHPKPPSTLTVGNSDIVMPPGVKTMLGEAEFAVIIGKSCRNLSEDEALSHVSHVAAANDVTVFDYNWSDAPSLVRSKGWDSFTPIGDLIPITGVDVADLDLAIFVNGERRQVANSSDLIFSFARLVSELSHIMTLEPGDVILTGTPAGAPALKPGDEVVVEISGGRSRTVNRVVADAREPSELVPPPRVTPRGRGVSIGHACHRQSLIGQASLSRLIEAGLERISAVAAEEGFQVASLRVAGAGEAMAGHAFTLRQVPVRFGGDRSSWPAGATKILDGLKAVGKDEIILAEGRFNPTDAEELRQMISDKGGVGLLSAEADDTAGFYQPVGVNQPISVNGVTINAGDVIVCDGARSVLINGADVDQLVEALG